jgi:predicted transcriptional regulator
VLESVRPAPGHPTQGPLPRAAGGLRPLDRGRFIGARRTAPDLKAYRDSSKPLLERLPPLSIPWYTFSMKTAISLPDDLFETADQLAARLGVSRSQLYATAVAEYVAKHRGQDVTARLNEVYSGEEASLEPELRRAQARSVGKPGW